MKIFLVSNMYPSKEDGLFGVFVKNFKQELENQGVTFSAISVIKGKSDSSIKKIFRYLSHYISIIKNFFSKKYDIIYLHYLTHHIPILLILYPFKNKPWVLNVHGNDLVYLAKHIFLKRIVNKILNNVNLIVVPSSYFKKQVLQNYPFLEESTVYVSPSGGIDSELFYTNKNIERENILHLGFISRFIEEKGWKTFLDALNKLEENGILFKATIAGKGPDEQRIKSYIRRYNLSNINFLGFVNQNELVHLYNEFDLYIFPTYRKGESLGLTGVEAMSCGTPVIACNMAGPSTYIRHNFNGFLFEPKNSNQLYNHIRTYNEMTTSQKEEMSKQALKHSLEFEKDKVAKRLISRLNKVINQGDFVSL